MKFVASCLTEIEPGLIAQVDVTVPLYDTLPCGPVQLVKTWDH